MLQIKIRVRLLVRVLFICSRRQRKMTAANAVAGLWLFYWDAENL